MSEFQFIGRRQPILDGPAKVTGHVQYLPNVHVPGMLVARFVISPYAHADIKSINSQAALQVTGVTAVLTAADLPDLPPTSRNSLLLARGRVLFAGQPVALVLAENAAAAADGVELVEVDYVPLPVAMTIEEAMAENAPLVWPSGVPGDMGDAGAHGADVGGEAKSQKPSNISGQTAFKRGDVAEGFKEAAVIVERTFTTSMVHQNYLETQGVLAQPDTFTGGATLWVSTQNPFGIREGVAESLAVEETAVRVIPTVPGGAFGGKFSLYENLIALAARQVGRPVRLVLSRGEDLLAGNPAPAARLWLKVGAKADGTLTAVQGHLTFDAGCYPSPHAIAALLLGSYYRVPHLDIAYTEVMTFKVSTGAYRAPGAPQATFALESVMDELAQKLGLDPIALRLHNACVAGDLMAHGRPWPELGLSKVLTALQAHPAWQNRATAQAQGRGVGIAVGGWPGGLEPTAASCQLHRDGTLQVSIGSVDLSGTPTGLALIAAEAFGCTPDKVRIVSGDTASAAFAGATGGSKITYMVGPSVIEAAQEARRQVLEIVAQELEADAADLEMVANQVRVKGVPDKGFSLAQVAQKTMRFGGKYAPVQGNGRHANVIPAPAFCAQLAEVSLDQETGEVTVHRLVLAQDIGRAINPLTVEGQMMGGATQGLGWALYEQMAFSEQGQLLTGSWADYTMPHFAQGATTIETILVENPSPHGPFGARGVGEPPIIATAGAVGNALANLAAIRLTDLPMTPPRILAALEAA